MCVVCDQHNNTKASCVRNKLKAPRRGRKFFRHTSLYSSISVGFLNFSFMFANSFSLIACFRPQKFFFVTIKSSPPQGPIFFKKTEVSQQNKVLGILAPFVSLICFSLCFAKVSYFCGCLALAWCSSRKCRADEFPCIFLLLEPPVFWCLDSLSFPPASFFGAPEFGFSRVLSKNCKTFVIFGDFLK